MRDLKEVLTELGDLWEDEAIEVADTVTTALKAHDKWHEAYNYSLTNWLYQVKFVAGDSVEDEEILLLAAIILYDGIKYEEDE